MQIFSVLPAVAGQGFQKSFPHPVLLRHPVALKQTDLIDRL